MSERTYKLPSGNELTVAKNKTVWYGLPGTKSILSDFYSILDLLALVDSLQQQVTERDAVIQELRVNNQAWQTDLLKEQQSTGKLRKDLAERDRTIAQYHPLREDMNGD
ncbi:hypothetical protein [Paenibacillus polymyxa]|uniref:hypothetical protein n=1 Tax=Paenibacillus polymyxa TaxID=1406 RepID=UPI0008FB98DE|nr:hypothetical protein [Paenibacillus polymyxa]